MNEIGKLWIINVFIQGLIQSLVVYVVKAANDVCFYGSVNLSPTLYVGKEALCSPYLPKAVRALEALRNRMFDSIHGRWHPTLFYRARHLCANGLLRLAMLPTLSLLNRLL